MLKSLESSGLRNGILFALWRHVACHSDSWLSLNVVIKQSRGNYASVLQPQPLRQTSYLSVRHRLFYPTGFDELSKFVTRTLSETVTSQHT